MTPAPTTRPRDAYIRVRITQDHADALEAIAREDGATVSEVVRRLVADEIRRRAPRDRPGHTG